MSTSGISATELMTEEVCRWGRRAMASIDPSFYNNYALQRQYAQATQCMNNCGISTEEFIQLEYFFIHVDRSNRSYLIAISPHNHIVEICSSRRVEPTHILERLRDINDWLINLRGFLPQPTWRYKYHRTAPR